MSIAVTQTSPRYQPLAQIGRGGMAEVILAEMQIGRGVTSLAVLKRLWPELADDPDFVSMFLREGRLCARMNHPNVVRTYEIVEDSAGAAIAMEYLDGQPLARVLNRLMGSGALGLSARLRVLLDVLAALDYAHELRDYDGSPHGIVHRDVNPQNVFVTYEGMVKLLDFGVAKSARDAYQTRPGELRGKLAYLAPEQALGEVVDRRADVFSVGVMLWEMMTGRRMWQSMTETSIMRQLTAGAIPPLPRDAVVAPGLADVCACALARVPEQRFGTAGEFASALQSLLPSGEEAKGRHLGRVVGLAFAPERAARRTLIEEHLRRARSACRDVGGGWTTSGMASADTSAALPFLRPDRPTPGGMWSLDDAQSLADAMELSLDDVLADAAEANASEAPVVPRVSALPMPPLRAVVPPPVPPRRLPPPTGSSKALLVSPRFRRTGWMAIGFALAVVVGGVSFAARSAGKPIVGTAVVRTGAVAPAAAPVRPLIVNAPLASGGAEAQTCSGAPTGAQGQPASATIVAPAVPVAVLADANASPSTGRRHRRRSRSASSETATDGETSKPDGRGRTGEFTTALTRGGRAHLDDETLEPTIDLSGAGASVGAVTASSAAASPSAPRPTPVVSPPPSRRSPVRSIDVADPFAP